MQTPKKSASKSNAAKSGPAKLAADKPAEQKPSKKFNAFDDDDDFDGEALDDLDYEGLGRFDDEDDDY